MGDKRPASNKNKSVANPTFKYTKKKTILNHTYANRYSESALELLSKVLEIQLKDALPEEKKSLTFTVLDERTSLNLLLLENIATTDIQTPFNKFLPLNKNIGLY